MKSTVLSVLFGLSVLLSTCSGHGYLHQSRAHLCHTPKAKNINCGRAQSHPDSVEGQKGFPAEGPKDGYIASGQNRLFPALNEFGAKRWAMTPISTYVTGEKDGKLVLGFPWTITAATKTTDFKYFISKKTFDPTKPLTRDQLELKPFCVDDSAWNTLPSKNYVTHNCTLDTTGYSGHHVILGVWEVSGRNAFYQVVDVDVPTAPIPALPTEKHPHEAADGTGAKNTPTSPVTISETVNGPTSPVTISETVNGPTSPITISEAIEMPKPANSSMSDGVTPVLCNWSFLAVALLFNFIFLMF